VVWRGSNYPAVCARCTVVLVKEGWVTDVDMRGDSLREIAISAGTVFQLDATGREVPLVIQNLYRAGEGRLDGIVPNRWLAGIRRVRGLVLEGKQLRSVIIASDELPFAPERSPRVVALNAAESGAAFAITPGSTVRVIGTGFLSSAASSGVVRILFAGDTAAQHVSVDASGSFSLPLVANRPPGEMEVTVEQRDGLRLTVAKATLDVMTTDAPLKPDNAKANR
jgi:hypothetical protein